MTSCCNLQQMACLCRHMWFMQDGATLHDANIVLDFLDIVFGPSVMSNRYPDHHNCSNYWPSLSPDLNPGDFNLWYSLKKKLFPRKPSNKSEIREMLIESCTEIEEDMCHCVGAKGAVSGPRGAHLAGRCVPVKIWETPCIPAKSNACMSSP